MKKIIFTLLFFVFLSFPGLVSAQSLSERWVCLNAVRCDKFKACKDLGFSGNSHIAYLTLPTGISLSKGSTTYIVECIATDAGQVCTTGNSTTDLTVYGQDNYTTLANLMEYNFEFLKTVSDKKDLSNPFTSNSDGSMNPIVWKDSTKKNQTRQWLALNYIEPEPTTSTASAMAGAAGALQQGTLAFSINDALGAGSDESCVTISWDPYGRVFDAQTLEPVSGSTVNLSIKRSDGTYSLVTTADVVGGNIINPQTVLEDGVFNFVVPDGKYKLSVTKTGYTFPITDIDGIHPNYSKIYSDIYPIVTGEEIVQSGSIQHRDIPILATGTSVETTPKLMEYIREAGSIQGKVSHPFAIITAYSIKPSSTNSKILTRYRQLKQVEADKNGYFTIVIDTSSFEKTETFGEFEITKTDLKTLTQNNLYKKIISFFTGFIKKTEAADTRKSTTTITFDPIPIYLEGYAYDATGNILPNATVSIYLTYSNKPYFQTKADEKGYFKISSEYLPKVAYKIKYTTTAGTTVATTTSQFINQNQQYLEEKSINLNTYKNSSGKELSKKDLKATINPTGFFKGTSGKTTTTNTEKTEPKTNNSIMLIVIILIFLIIVTALAIGIYVMKKKQSQPPVPPAL